MAEMVIPGVAVTYRALPSCVSRARTGLSKHKAGVEPLLCLDDGDRGRACARGGGIRSMHSQESTARPGTSRLQPRPAHTPTPTWV